MYWKGWICLSRNGCLSSFTCTSQSETGKLNEKKTTIKYIIIFFYKILIVGGGDGGVIREVVKHPQVEEVILCEIDQVKFYYWENEIITGFFFLSIGCYRCKQKISSGYGKRIC